MELTPGAGPFSQNWESYVQGQNSARQVCERENLHPEITIPFFTSLILDGTAITAMVFFFFFPSMSVLWGECHHSHVAQTHNHKPCSYKLPCLFAMPHCELTDGFLALPYIIPSSTFPVLLLCKHLQLCQAATRFFISSACISLCCPGWILLLYPPDKAIACMIKSLPPTMRLAANLTWELFIPSWYLLLTTIKVEFNNWDSQHPSGTCPYFNTWLLIVGFYLFTVLQAVFSIQSCSLTLY